MTLFSHGVNHRAKVISPRSSLFLDSPQSVYVAFTGSFQWSRPVWVPQLDSSRLSRSESLLRALGDCFALGLSYNREDTHRKVVRIREICCNKLHT